MRRSALTSSASETASPIVQDVSCASGQPMRSETRNQMESHFGYDLSSVPMRYETEADGTEQESSPQAFAAETNRDNDLTGASDVKKYDQGNLSCVPRTAISIDEIIRKAPSQGNTPDATTRNLIEAQLGEDIGDVRIHTDRHAHAACRRLGAKAFTISSHIFFAQGEYNPYSEEGQRLLVHEATHVVQQRGNGFLALHSPAETRTLEGEADRMSENVNSLHGNDVAGIEPRHLSQGHTVSLTHTHPGVLFGARRRGESYRDCINRRLGEMGLEIHIGWIVIGLCGVVAAIAGAVGAEAGVIPPAVLAAAGCLALATGVEIGILAGILWDCR